MVIHELTKRFLEQVGNVQALVGLEQLGQRSTAIQGEVGVVGQQSVFLAFDKPAVLAREPSIFTPERGSPVL
jgi:hypothetical protein